MSMSYYFLHLLLLLSFFFFFNDTATTEIYTLSLHDALPICVACTRPQQRAGDRAHRHTSQSRTDPRPFHPENPVFRSTQNSVPLLGHNCPDERRASLGRQDCVEFA